MAEHFDGKSPFILSQTPWSPPKKRNRDVITVKHDPIWSDMRTEAIGRRVWSYSVTNETKGSEYSTELFEGISGEPCGVCNCNSWKTICKHLLNCIVDVLKMDASFGEGFESEAINEAKRILENQ